jgi:hypothetical protein
VVSLLFLPPSLPGLTRFVYPPNFRRLSLTSYARYDPTGHKDPPSKGHWLTKTGYAGLAFLGATFWGGLSAFVIAGFLDIFFKLAQSESLLGAAFTAAFAAAAAFPLFKFFLEKKEVQVGVKEKEKGKGGGKEKEEGEGGGKEKEEGEGAGKEKKELTIGDFVKAYAAVAGVVTLLVNLVISPDQLWTVDSLIFALFVLLPTGITAAKEAWECAGEGPQVHEGFYELYDPTGDTSKPLPQSGKSPRVRLDDL